MIALAIIIIIVMAIAIFSPNDSQQMTDYELYGTDDLEDYEDKVKNNNINS